MPQSRWKTIFTWKRTELFQAEFYRICFHEFSQTLTSHPKQYAGYVPEALMYSTLKKREGFIFLILSYLREHSSRTASY